MLLIATFFASSMVAAQASTSADEQRLVDLINSERSARGISPLVVVSDLTAAAEEQAGRMADAGKIFHNPDLADVTTDWYTLGENVGMGGDIDSLHRAFMNSAGHRANILNPDFDGVGVGVVWKGGIPYVSEVFMDAIYPLPGQYKPPFWDDDNSVFENDIITLYKLGVTNGCDTHQYCPYRTLTRGEMSALLVRAFSIPSSSRDFFTDDENSIFESDINAMAAAGITMGCSEDRFCPDRAITRSEMAVFLDRILGLPGAPSAGFTDTRGLQFEASIDAIAAAGITAGCTPTKFCPDADVTRGQMAAFLVRALEH